jgi:hypothetical protein
VHSAVRLHEQQRRLGVALPAAQYERLVKRVVYAGTLDDAVMLVTGMHADRVPIDAGDCALRALRGSDGECLMCWWSVRTLMGQLLGARDAERGLWLHKLAASTGVEMAATQTATLAQLLREKGDTAEADALQLPKAM